MAQAWIDYRAIGATQDPDHATAIFLVKDGEVTPAHVAAAHSLATEMNAAVAKKLDLKDQEVADLFKQDPNKYIATVDELLKQDAIGSTPELKEYIKMFAEAYRRQVIDKDIKPAPKVAAADNVLPEGIEWIDYKPYEAKPLRASSDINLEDIKGGKPSVMVGETNNKTLIGGVSASSFFASHARPDLAQQRLNNVPEPVISMSSNLNFAPLAAKA